MDQAAACCANPLKFLSRASGAAAKSNGTGREDWLLFANSRGGVGRAVRDIEREAWRAERQRLIYEKVISKQVMLEAVTEKPIA